MEVSICIEDQLVMSKSLLIASYLPNHFSPLIVFSKQVTGVESLSLPFPKSPNSHTVYLESFQSLEQIRQCSLNASLTYGCFHLFYSAENVLSDISKADMRLTVILLFQFTHDIVSLFIKCFNLISLNLGIIMIDFV